MSSPNLLEAWKLALDHSEWAEEVRAHLLAHGLSQPQTLQAKITAGPDLPAAWHNHQGFSLEHMQQLLTPAPEVAMAWQQGHADRGPVYVPLTHIDPCLWRGPQPSLEDLQQYKEQGLRAVINLRLECPSSQQWAAQAGLHYLYIPVQDMSVPTVDQVVGFLGYFANEQNPTPALVHCFAGQGRTGLFVAAYRIWRGMPVEEAITLTNVESTRKGMRPCQQAWLRQHMKEVLENLCSPSK